MPDPNDLSTRILDALQARLGERVAEYRVPPPVFVAMQGQFVAFDPEAGTLSARFPVRERDLNPYGSMQGGMVAAAIDNTLGPLSMLVAPPNVTRRLEVTYSRPVTLAHGHILVEARFLSREGRWLRLRADVLDPDGARLARAKATHWVLDEG
jgi:acyl-coenzyme A thioesterase PaaI-like protein